MSVIMTVDPGLGGLGIATWSAGLWGDYNASYQTCLVLHFAKDCKTYEDRITSMATVFDRLVRGLDLNKVVFEFPEHYESAGGRVTAESGSLVKLAVLTGTLVGVLIKQDRVPVIEFVTPTTWKGQVRKELMQDRLKTKISDTMLYDLEHRASHAWDAVGIGVKLQEDYADAARKG